MLAVTFPAVGQTDDRSLYQQAESRFRSRDYELALDLYNQLLKEYPLSSYVPDVQFRRAVCLFRLDRSSEALALFKKIEQQYPASSFIAFVPFWIGVIDYNTQNFTEAAYNLRKYVEKGDTSLLGQAKLYLAISDDELGNQTEAISLLNEVVGSADNPASEPYALVLLASLYVKQGQYDQIEQLSQETDYSRLTTADAQRMHLYLAEAYWHKGELDNAVKLYRDLLDAPPDVSSVAYQRLFVYYDQKGDESSLQNVVNAAEIKLAGYPSILSEFWLRIGIESYRKGKIDLAQSYFQRIWNMGNRKQMNGLVPLYLSDILYETGSKTQAVDILQSFLSDSDSQSDLILRALAGYYLDMGNWEKAATYYKEFLSNFADSKAVGEVSYLYAYVLYKSAQYKDALTVIEGVLQDARAGSETPNLLQLQSIIYKETGDLASAVQTLKEYIPLAPTDLKAKMDLIKLYFQLQQYNNVVSEVEKIKDTAPFSTPTSPYFLLSRYLYGLALITIKSYSEAATVLSGITLKSVQAADLSIIYPYALFYRGWALYREGKYDQAESDFAEFLKRAPDSDLQPRAAYLAGWCAYSLGRYEEAAAFMQSVSPSADEATRNKARFMYAKSLAGQGLNDKAATAFDNIVIDSPDSSVADDALFEYAGVLAKLGKVQESVDAYQELYKEHASSPLAEEAMYKRGEIYYTNKKYEDAREAFYEYRITFPKGKLFDAALYWGGMAADAAGEPFGAVLLWEMLIENYKDSAFRADSLNRTAEIYENSGDFRKALNYYTELISAYPDEAKAADAQTKADKLRYLILGQGEKEANLSVIIARDGLTTKAGRDATLELARIYIYKSGSKQDLAPPLLEGLIKKKDVDPSDAAHAQYLIGEYYYRQNDPARAANEFLKTVTINPDDRDLIAQSMYRAAEMTKLAGNTKEAQDLVDKLASLFPSSQWVEAGRKLLEEPK